MARVRYEEDPSGLGMLGMEERVKQLGGKLDFKSAAGQGTRLTAMLPIPTGMLQLDV